MAKQVTAWDRGVGSRIRLRRKQTNVSEDRLAEMLGVSVSDIRSYESGSTRIGAEGLARTGKALGVSIDYFFTGLKEINAPARGAASLQNLSASSGAAELLRAYSRISSSPLRAAVLQLVQHLAREAQGSVSAKAGTRPRPALRSNSRAR